MDFGEFIKKHRLRKKMSIRQLAKYSGVSNAYLSQMERGERPSPSPEILKKLALPLDVPYEELMEKAGHLMVDNKELEKKEADSKEILITPDNKKEWELNLQVLKEIVAKLARGERGDLPESNANGIMEYLSFQIAKIEEMLNKQK